MIDDRQVELARTVSIFKLIGLNDNGRRQTIRCVFHEDHSPSLVIYPKDGGFHCFACGAHGKNAIDFVVKLGYKFKDAVEELQQYV